MKKVSFFTFFITIHLIFIFLQIHKHTLFIQNNYNQQECEKKIITLTEQKKNLTQQLYALKDPQTIKQYAEDVLQMRPYTLNQIKKIKK